MKEIKVFAPATIANVGPAYDILGFAINFPGDEIILKKNETGKLKITEISGENGVLSYDPQKNTVTVAIKALLDRLNIQQGFDVKINKKMPIGSGLGSSAASSAGGAFAANYLLGEPLNKFELVKVAMQGEKTACGYKHADNVAPCLLGGFVLISSYTPLKINNLNTPANLYCSVIHPDIIVRTKDAREILPKKIPLEIAVKQWGNIAGLIAALYKEDFSLLESSINDLIIEPSRATLIPHFYLVKEKALQNGAIACSISGSGPSIFALSKDKDTAEKVGNAMKEIFDLNHLKSELYVSLINTKGPKIF